MAKGDFSSMFTLILATTYGGLGGPNANFARDESLEIDLLGFAEGVGACNH
jgi:hypothetical protein